MSNVHAALHANLGKDHLDLAQIAEDLNRLLYAHTAPDKFVTFFFGAVQKETRRFRYVSAGHEPPLLLRPGCETRLLDVGGLPLGLLPGSTYRIGEEQMEVGDLLCLYTDGVTEASNAMGEMFERERLAETLVGARAKSSRKSWAASSDSPGGSDTMTTSRSWRFRSVRRTVSTASRSEALSPLNLLS
jgi:sigma-B regulation protein RsbU (phosphoserine phosphatase)